MKRRQFVGCAGLLSAALLVASCNDAGIPVRPVNVSPAFDAVPGPPVLDQRNGTIGFNGSDIRKGFNPTNPQTGDAIIATFIWQGSTNVITSVHDELTNGTPVGNTYNLVEYRTAGGISMATYVALNVQNIPDNAGNQDLVEVVIGTLSSPITNGGIMISAYRGVATASALTGHASGGGTGSTTTVATGGPITPGDGSLLYTASAVAPNAPTDPPSGMNEVNYLSTPEMKILGEWAVQSGGGASDPQWTWYFSQPSSWIVTNLALLANASAPQTGDLTATAGTTGSGLDPDGYTVTVDGSSPQAVATNGSVTFSGLSAGDHSVALSGVASNCTVGGANPRTVSVPAGGTGSVTFAVSCVAPNTSPVVNAGADETVPVSLLFSEAWSFTDPDNGPWSYTIDWGDGTFSTGTKSAPGSFSQGHTYGTLLLGQHTIRITVTDSQGASHTDTKVVTVVLF